LVSPAQDSEPPKSIANVTPIDAGVTPVTRVLIDAVKEQVADLKDDVKEIKSHRFADLLWHIGGLVGLAVIIGGLMLTIYFKLEEKISSIAKSSTKVETRLEDLIARIPPAPTPIPKKE
jgi:hypothetical protein